MAWDYTSLISETASLGILLECEQDVLTTFSTYKLPFKVVVHKPFLVACVTLKWYNFCTNNIIQGLQFQANHTELDFFPQGPVYGSSSLPHLTSL